MTDQSTVDPQWTAEEQAQLDQLLARRTSALRRQARERALAEIVGVEPFLLQITASTALASLRDTAAIVGDSGRADRLRRLAAIIETDGAALLADIDDLRGTIA